MNRILSPQPRKLVRSLKLKPIDALPILRSSERRRERQRTTKKFRKEVKELCITTKKSIESKLLSRKLKVIRAKKSQKKAQTHCSNESVTSDASTLDSNPKLLSQEEERKWISIHGNVMEDVKNKVNHAKKLRFLGFFSPTRLNEKANTIIQHNRKRIYTFSCERRRDIKIERQEGFRSPVIRNQKLIQSNLDQFSFRRRQKESKIDSTKLRIRNVLSLLSKPHL